MKEDLAHQHAIAPEVALEGANVLEVLLRVTFADEFCRHRLSLNNGVAHAQDKRLPRNGFLCGCGRAARCRARD
ncbi:MAG: hypothetical protein K1X78_23970 [Verrucomicrobiaceae bacterium]|nr:hypothetical protein [Verrucomicrobiaceae bacterium]